MKKYNVAVVGATGLVGQTFLKVLKERNFPIENLYLYASSRSAGKLINFNGKDYTIIELKDENIREDLDVALFSAGGDISLEFAPKFKAKGALVVDNSSAWRMNKDIPLVVPEANPEALENHNGIIANPNCSTIQVMPILKVLHEKYGLKRVIYSTYQAVAGSGQKGIDDLEANLKGESSKGYPHQIAFNLIPHIDAFLDNGYTKEEIKMIEETRKILGIPNLKVTATCVRVPVKMGHAVSINVELENSFKLEDVIKAFEEKEGVIVRDDVKNNIYPMPIEAEDTDEVYVGRIRRDESIDNGLNLWVVADNIRKGAATNTIQIAETLIKKGVL
ncbi:MAG: aspartate-semialdehyde dehydrogenase [Leptotrichiaceae bacterium]|nr:aspartate-semialdehyde dehydrogenase [Leptotrichiaceae bacterium]MBP6280788.1 aspartate-semialdehyde dehydrogenase [Leptotrichiaceae bacterium]MBP7099984.1 aspartate-semialdehyde dehydrogenase [Leptotrichiaceae bacterium]MBP7725070.1 aspartate-semialdehyde dehydrogenase [Leptotrichiaceae bacterium]MBP9629457.1 aspartate-semialdehyde dehydrogenase [Leptotrichiaceae bacterium]